MTALDEAVRDFRRLDTLAAADFPAQRLDARAKLLSALACMVCVASFPRTELSAMLPFALYPVAMAARAGVPFGYVLRKALPALPAAALLAAFNPLVDQSPGLRLGHVEVSAGWLSVASVALRALLCASAGVALVAATGFPRLCAAFGRRGPGAILAAQVSLMYRYAQVLADEAARLVRARDLRSTPRRGRGPASAAALIGQLLLRSWDRAERIHQAMRARGYDGSFPAPEGVRFGRAELVHVSAWLAAFALFRAVDLPDLLGALLVGGFS